MVKVSVLGGTGYTGMELVRLLKSHSQVKSLKIYSKSHSTLTLGDIYPNFSTENMELFDIREADKIYNEYVFCALPHGVSIDLIPSLLENNNRVIDLSGDFRYKDVETYNFWYKGAHKHPELLKESVYGLPELYKNAITKGDLIANPGCYPTATILSLMPLLKEDLIDENNIFIDAKSGVSGAGKGMKEDLQFCEVDGNFKAYGIATHRHTSEIEQELSIGAMKDIRVSFTPHLIPIKRGMLVTSYGVLKKKVSHQDIFDVYKKLYHNDPFVFISEKIPEIKDIIGSNNCHIGFAIDERLGRIIIVSVIDNLLKGASGQGIQNFNLMLNLPETTGLPMTGWYL